MTIAEALAELNAAAVGIGQRVPSIKETAEGMAPALSESHFWQRQKIRKYLANTAIFLEQVRNIENLEIRATKVISSFESLRTDAAASDAHDLQKAIESNVSYVSFLLSADDFLRGLGAWGAFTDGVQHEKLVTLGEYEARARALGQVAAFFVENANSLREVNPGELTGKRAALMALIDNPPWDVERLAERLEEMKKAANIEFAKLKERRREQQENEKRKTEDARRANEATQSLLRDEKELQAWSSALSVEARGEQVAADTAETMKNYESDGGGRGRSGVSDPSWPRQLRDLSARWREFAQNYARRQLEELQRPMEFCRSAKVGRDSDNRKRHEDLESGIASIQRGPDYEDWRARFRALDKSLREQFLDGGEHLRGWLEEKVTPHRERIAALRQGPTGLLPLLAEHRAELDGIDRRIDAISHTRSEGFEDWQRSSGELEKLGPEIEEIRRTVTEFRTEVAANQAVLRSESAELAQASAASGVSALADIVARAVDLGDNPDFWRGQLEKERAALDRQKNRFAEECAKEYSVLRARAVLMVKAGLSPGDFESADALPEIPSIAAGMLVLLRRQVEAGEKLCGQRLGEYANGLPGLMERIGLLEAQDANGQLESTLESLRRDIGDQIIFWNAPGAASPDQVRSLIDIGSLRNRVNNLEKKVNEDLLRMQQRFDEIGRHMSALSEKELADFTGAVMPEHWNWIRACMRGAKEARGFLCAWSESIEPQLKEAGELLSRYDTHAQRVEGERFWLDMDKLEKLRTSPNLDFMRKAKLEKFYERAAKLPVTQLPPLDDRNELKRLV